MRMYNWLIKLRKLTNEIKFEKKSYFKTDE